MTFLRLLRIAFALNVLVCIVTPLLVLESIAQQQTSPLEPPATDSPRATLFGFLNELDIAYRLGANDEGQASSVALERALKALNLSELPPKFAKNRGIEAALMLKEVLDRIELPSPDEVPDAPVDQSSLLASDKEASDIIRIWEIPHTEIGIGLVTEGFQAGEYLFTPETVSRVDEFYNKVKKLPYKVTSTPNIYEIYLSTPGHGLEAKWNNFFPDWSKNVFNGQTWWQWILSIISIVLSATVILYFIRIGLKIDRHLNVNDEKKGSKWQPATTIFLLISLFSCILTEWFIAQIINLTGRPLEVFLVVISLVQYGLLCWLIIVVVRQLTEFLIVKRHLDSGTASGHLIRLLNLLFAIGIVGSMVVIAGRDFGLPTYSLVTGLGVGGIAIGFGAQSLVRDVFSGILFLTDDAFREGEYVEVDGAIGTVDKISVRSLRLRHHLGALHVIPYGEIRQLTNNSRDWVIVKQKFTVPFDTDLNRVKSIFKEIGQSMYEDPYYSDNIIEPFKMQGVYDVDDIGIIVRSKFMAKPGSQFIIKKDAYDRVQQAFEENHIEFARREVRVKVAGIGAASSVTQKDMETIGAAASEAALKSRDVKK